MLLLPLRYKYAQLRMNINIQENVNDRVKTRDFIFLLIKSFHMTTVTTASISQKLNLQESLKLIKNEGRPYRVQSIALVSK